MWDNSVGFSSKSCLEWASCSLILFCKSVRCRLVGGSVVITRNFVDDIGSEVGRKSGLRFGEKVP